ncbi:patched domain-containing protein 3-like [Centruroides sculpturatus]|uniref:patched domain-containing protein 3-like n=1 Tax=Centruroides sculpturatus TaxID=218467 RepID=UPI000C6DDDC1|nr:patched domain-containing protein 3-like [Centruroides sculpturatus]
MVEYCNLIQQRFSIGVDDAFILIAAWRRTDVNASVPDRMKDSYAEAAVSITITSLTNFFAFCMGFVTPYKMIHIFSAHQVQIVINQKLDYSNLTVQNDIEDLLQSYESAPFISDSSTTESWLREFLAFTKSPVAKFSLSGYNLSDSEDFLSAFKDVFLKAKVANRFIVSSFDGESRIDEKFFFENVGLIGYMSLWNVTVNTTALMILVMSTGFCVDYTVHMAYAFINCGNKTPNEKIKSCLYVAGYPVTQACISTMLSVSVLSFGPSESFVAIFKIVTLMVIFASFHSLVILPVILSLLDFIPSCLKSSTRKIEYTGNALIEMEGLNHKNNSFIK